MKRLLARTRDGGGEGGYIVVALALLLIVLLGFAALAVDVGVLHSDKASTQRAADAAALAGAFTFVVDPTSPQPATATQQALQTAANNQVLGDAVKAGDVTVSVDVPKRFVTVDVKYNQTSFFAKALGIGSTPITARANAEASANSTSSYCVKPWFIPNTILSTDPPCTACGASQVMIKGGAVTAFALSKLGAKISIKPQNPSGAMAPGQFFAIQLPGSVGASDYRNNIKTCAPIPLGCAESYSVETGDMVGPTKQGVNDLIGKPPVDSYVGVGQYRHADGTISDTSVALVVAPIWDACGMPGFCPGNKFPTGTKVELKIVGYALIFLEGIAGNDVVARLINVFSCGSAPGGSTEVGPFSIPVRLVRPVK